MIDLDRPVAPKLVTADQLLRRAVTLLASERPELSRAELGHLLIERAVDAFAAMTGRPKPAASDDEAPS